ncbi:hypothetical protein BDA96_06G104400 [Sorghum bicolor]|uniref:Uncharacterized protein n=1 Tax=Sorghum bicolor TaxID=4558 RepID=A0A921UBJ8_SORBI|nr:hypothetical protein BDA96_06G104400 [Sorghum bicolor]
MQQLATITSPPFTSSRLTSSWAPSPLLTPSCKHQRRNISSSSLPSPWLPSLPYVFLSFLHNNSSRVPSTSLLTLMHTLEKENLHLLPILYHGRPFSALQNPLHSLHQRAVLSLLQFVLPLHHSF